MYILMVKKITTTIFNILWNEFITIMNIKAASLIIMTIDLIYNFSGCPRIIDLQLWKVELQGQESERERCYSECVLEVYYCLLHHAPTKQNFSGIDRKKKIFVIIVKGNLQIFKLHFKIKKLLQVFGVLTLKNHW